METTKEIKVIEGKVENAIEAASKMSVIKTDEQLGEAAAFLTNIKKLQKFVVGEKEKITKPINEALRAARGMFAPFEAKISEAEAGVKRAIIAYQEKKAKEVAKKEANIEARVGKGQLKEETAMRKLDELADPTKAVITGEGTVSFRKTKAVRVTNREIVPEQYWVLDMVAVRRDAIATGKLGEVIPGVEVYEETNVAASV